MKLRENKKVRQGGKTIQIAFHRSVECNWINSTEKQSSCFYIFCLYGFVNFNSNN